MNIVRVIKAVISILLIFTLVILVTNLLTYKAPVIEKKPFVIGKNQSQINSHDYKILEALALNAQLPMFRFRSVNSSPEYIVDPSGFLYVNKNDEFIFYGDSVEHLVLDDLNAYKTDEKGNVVAISIEGSKFSDTRILNKFKHLIAISLTNNNIERVDLIDLPELRFLSINESRVSDTATNESSFQLTNLPNLTYLKLLGLNLPNFNTFTGVENVKKIKIAGNNLQNFEGLAKMPKLRSADITAVGSHQDSEAKALFLTGVPEKHKLDSLVLSAVLMTDISGIENFAYMKLLDLHVYSSEIADYTPLSQLKRLQALELHDLGLRNFSFLKSMPELRQIKMQHVPITSLLGLGEAPNLERLELRNGQLDAMTHIDHNIHLKTVILNHHNITKIEGLEGLVQLNSLDLTANKISKIDGLEDNLCLERLWLEDNPVDIFENLFHLPLLYSLGIKNTDIKTFPNYEKAQRLKDLDFVIDALDEKAFDLNYAYWTIPIQGFDEQMRNVEPITYEERKQYGCI